MHPLSFSFPIAKFEKLEDGRMLIQGTATDETLDSQGDILDYEGSKKAFGDWRGNVREAHDPKKMVGKALEVAFDDTAKTIGVSAFISSGALDTQAKVSEGVLTCFSVGGGAPTKVKPEKVNGRTIRRVLEWPMSELSVVDAGANPNAVFQLVKADGTATEVLAEEVVAEVVAATNRFADKLLKAVDELKQETGAAPAQEEPKTEEPVVEVKKADDEPDPEDKKEPAEGEDEEKKACDKCNKEHEAECDKQDIAAADTARAKQGVEEAKAKHKVAQAKEDLAAAKGKLEEVKGGGEEKPAEKADAADEIKKAPQDLDLNDAVAILTRIRSLHMVEASEDEMEAAQLALLDAACDNICQFIALEATEPQEMPGDMKPLAMSAKTSDSVFVKAILGAIKTREAAPADLFTANHGDQLAEGIGKGLMAALAPLSKALGDLKTELGEVKAAREKVDVEKALAESPLLKTMGETIEKIAKQPAVAAPLKTVPRDEATPRRVSDNGVAVLEKALASTTHPETMVHLRQQIAVAKAMPRE
jgi:hypothetical protein